MWENAVLKRAIEEAPRKGGNHEGHKAHKGKAPPLCKRANPVTRSAGLPWDQLSRLVVPECSRRRARLE